MVSRRVGSEADRPLPTLPEHADWRPGGIAMRFRASIVRNNYKWGVLVTCLSADRERAFVRIESRGGVEMLGTQTMWVSCDELQEG